MLLWKLEKKKPSTSYHSSVTFILLSSSQTAGSHDHGNIHSQWLENDLFIAKPYHCQSMFCWQALAQGCKVIWKLFSWSFLSLHSYLPHVLRSANVLSKQFNVLRVANPALQNNDSTKIPFPRLNEEIILVFFKFLMKW